MKEEDKREQVIMEGYEKLAFGDICDPIRLLFCEEVSPRALKKMDLFSVAEIKRPKGGGMEIKFVDRLKALQCMEAFVGANKADGGFYEALERSAGALGDEDDEV